jgi:hypothetical protein
MQAAGGSPQSLPAQNLSGRRDSLRRRISESKN